MNALSPTSILPPDVARAAWEQAYELLNSFADRLNADEEAMCWRVRLSEQREIAAGEAADVAEVWGRVVGVRV